MDDCDNRSQHNATQFGVCQSKTHTPVPVNYGTPAAKVACPLHLVENFPGTSAFLTQEYGSFIDFTKQIIPCPGTLCEANEKVVDHVCVECAAGETSTGNHDASRGDTTCEATKCGVNEKVVDHVCVECPAGKTSTGSHDASGGNTACEATTCGANEKVVDHVCVECPGGKTSTGSHDASGGNTACEATNCGANEKVVNHVCAECPAGKTTNCSHDASGGNTTCETSAFPNRYRVQIIPGSRYDHETCACASLEATCFE